MNLFKLISTILLFSLVIIFHVNAQEIKKIKVAVIDFEGKGVSDMEASTLTDRFRSELVKTREFIVSERGQMQEILKEQGLQQTGACNTSECFAEVGKILGVEQMIGGSIGKIGQLFTIDVRVIDVKTAEITETVTVDHRGGIEGLLEVFKNIANQFAAKNYEDVKPVAIKPIPTKKMDKVEVQFKTKPIGAAVTIDGKLQKKVTPFSIKLRKGSHKIIINKNYYKTEEKKYTINNKQTIYVELDLTEDAKRKLEQRRKEIALAKKREEEEKKKQTKITTKKGGGKGKLWVGVGVLAIGGAVAALALSGGGNGGDGGDNNATVGINVTF